MVKRCTWRTPKKAGKFYADYMRQQLLAIAADHGVPYEIMTGDWGELNDRVYRAAMESFKREIEAVQDLYMVDQVWPDCADLVDGRDYSVRTVGAAGFMRQTGMRI